MHLHESTQMCFHDFFFIIAHHENPRKSKPALYKAHDIHVMNRCPILRVKIISNFFQ